MAAFLQVVLTRGQIRMRVVLQRSDPDSDAGGDPSGLVTLDERDPP